MRWDARCRNGRSTGCSSQPSTASPKPRTGRCLPRTSRPPCATISSGSSKSERLTAHGIMKYRPTSEGRRMTEEELYAKRHELADKLEAELRKRELEARREAVWEATDAT